MNDIAIIRIGIFFLVVMIGIILSALFNKYFEDKSFCYQMGWHWVDYNKATQWFDGCSAHNICARCGREVMQDSQGNWF